MIRIGDAASYGDAAAGDVTPSTSDVFRVEAINGTNITLDRPWPYPTITFSGGQNDIQVLPKAHAEGYADSTWSLEIVGVPVIESTAASKTFTRTYITDFHVGLECNLDCNATVTESQALVQPEGYGVGIQQMEINASRKSKPYMGATITDQPESGYDYFVGTGTTQTTAYFGQIIVDYTDCGHSSAEQPIISNKRLIIAVDAGDTTLLGTATAGAASVTTDTILEWWARYCDVLDVNFEMEQIDLDAGTD